MPVAVNNALSLVDKSEANIYALDFDEFIEPTNENNL